MAFQLPRNFGARVNNLVQCMTTLESAVDPKTIQAREREALQICCELLSSVSMPHLKKELAAILGEPGSVNRKGAKKILDDGELFELFMMMEEKIFRRADIAADGRERILTQLRLVRPQTAEEIEQVSVDTIANAFMLLKSDVCGEQARVYENAKRSQLDRLRKRKHTEYVNTLGTATTLINGAVVGASAISLFFFPPLSLAAAAASSVLGAVAARKPKADD